MSCASCSFKASPFTKGAMSNLVPPPAPKSHYRRSTTSKAPRKRTFIANMEKYLIAKVEQVSPTATFASMSADERCAAPCFNPTEPCMEAQLLELGSGDGNGSGRNNGGKSWWGNGDNGNSGDGHGEGAAHLKHLPKALLAVLAISLALPVSPARALASGVMALPSALAYGRVDSAPSGASGGIRRRSKVMHVALEGSTLVVPLPAGAASGLYQPKQSLKAKIWEAPIELSEYEARSIANMQYNVREFVRV